MEPPKILIQKVKPLVKDACKLSNMSLCTGISLNEYHTILALYQYRIVSYNKCTQCGKYENDDVSIFRSDLLENVCMLCAPYNFDVLAGVHLVSLLSVPITQLPYDDKQMIAIHKVRQELAQIREIIDRDREISTQQSNRILALKIKENDLMQVIQGKIVKLQEKEDKKAQKLLSDKKQSYYDEYFKKLLLQIRKNESSKEVTVPENKIEEKEKLISPEEKMKKSPRKSASKATRKTVWLKSAGKTYIYNCPICNGETNPFDFECGHIISHANGGPTIAKNLTVICGTCNKSMSSMNFDEYMREHGHSEADIQKITGAKCPEIEEEEIDELADLMEIQGSLSNEPTQE